MGLGLNLELTRLDPLWSMTGKEVWLPSVVGVSCPGGTWRWIHVGWVLAET